LFKLHSNVIFFKKSFRSARRDHTVREEWVKDIATNYIRTILLRLKIGIFDAKLLWTGGEDGIKVRFTYNLPGHSKGDKRILLYL
jgi:hypothetical protein